MHIFKKMASLVLAISLLFANFASPLVESANYSYGYTKPAPSLNPIDACWRRNPNWASSRQALARCAVGFGKAAIGGKRGPIYVVTDPSDKSTPGTLRFGVSQPKPLWITFARDMVIVLKSELMIHSYKTIDGRGAKVQIGNGPCLRIRHVRHVIIHGVSFLDCKPAMRENHDGDAIRIFGSTHVWIDHCLFSRSQDGLIDVVQSSTAVTISNNYFTQQPKVMLLGNSDTHMGDKIMKVTIAFNYFGPGLASRMPRVRRGYAHIANNRYEKWQNYAIGGSANPIIFSEGNYFVAGSQKQVAQRFGNAPDTKKWKWSTLNDIFMNGAVFVPSGGTVRPPYKMGESFPVARGSLVPSLTASAGPLLCHPGRIC